LAEALLALPRGRKAFRLVNSRGEPLTSSGVSLMITKPAKAAGMRPSMKTLRKGFGCRYASVVSAQMLQRLMRHSNISVTMDDYANLDDAAMRAVLGRKRNTSRNGGPSAEGQGTRHGDANPDPRSDFD
jgi:integrase